MVHERTKIGRALLTQKRKVDAWVEANRGTANTEAAELLSCELYYAAVNGTTERLLRRHYGTVR